MKPDVKKIMVDTCNWKVYCSKCEKWYHVIIAEPGTKTASSVPGHCKSCIKKKNDEDRMSEGPKRYYPLNHKKRIYEDKYRWFEIENETCSPKIENTNMRTDIKSTMITSTHWRRECPDCKKTFDIFLKPPGLTNREKLPTYCKKCTKIRNANRTKKRVVQCRPSKYCNGEQMAALLSGSVQDLLKAPTRPNPYDETDSWRKSKGGTGRI